MIKCEFSKHTSICLVKKNWLYLLFQCISLWLISLHTKYQKGRKVPAPDKVFLIEWFPIHLLPSSIEKSPKLRFLWRFDFSLPLYISKGRPSLVVTGWKIPHINSPSSAAPPRGHNPCSLLYLEQNSLCCALNICSMPCTEPSSKDSFRRYHAYVCCAPERHIVCTYLYVVHQKSISFPFP